MNDIHCSEEGCTNLITDPCVKLKGLFAMRKELLERLISTKEEEVQTSLKSIDSLLQKELGLSTTSDKSILVQLEKREQENDPILFTLKCIDGHVNQYLITCHL